MLCPAPASCLDTAVTFNMQTTSMMVISTSHIYRLQPMITFGNARSTARRFVANEGSNGRTDKPSISVGRSSADPSLAQCMAA